MGFKRMRIDAFKGLDTSKGNFGDNAAFSPNAINFVCEDGMMKTAGGTREYAPMLPKSCESLFQAFFRDAQMQTERRVLMAAGGGCIYALGEGGWQEIASECKGDAWRAVNYRSGEQEMLLMVNGVDGILAWDGVNERAQKMSVTQGGEEIYFEHLTLLYERLWGAVYSSAPDRIYWSESFEPDNWEVNYDVPDAGGGFLDVATFDGSRIRSIVAAFDDILIFKDKSMHRLNGTYPGEFSLTQVYGSEGTIAPRTIVHTADRLYFLGTDGLCIYNGMSAAALAHSGNRRLEGIWERMNRLALRKACAVIHKDVLYLALPLDDAEQNSHVLEYRLNEGTVSLIELAGIQEWLVVRGNADETLVCLIGNQVYEYGVGGVLAGAEIKAYWTSPEMTFSTLLTKRTMGRVCMMVEAYANGGENGLEWSFISGKTVRKKRIRLKEGVNLIRQRIRIRGRTIRFQIENVDGCRLCIPNGMEILLEEDSDS